METSAAYTIAVRWLTKLGTKEKLRYLTKKCLMGLPVAYKITVGRLTNYTKGKLTYLVNITCLMESPVALNNNKMSNQ